MGIIIRPMKTVKSNICIFLKANIGESALKLGKRKVKGVIVYRFTSPFKLAK